MVGNKVSLLCTFSSGSASDFLDHWPSSCGEFERADSSDKDFFEKTREGFLTAGSFIINSLKVGTMKWLETKGLLGGSWVLLQEEVASLFAKIRLKGRNFLMFLRGMSISEWAG